MEGPISRDCEDICSGIETLEIGDSRAEVCNNLSRRGSASGRETNPFLKPKIPRSQLPVPATPTRQVEFELVSLISRSVTPRKPVKAPFINRFTNDRCPDFYNERMEAMERDFRMFKEKMEGDVRQATDYKESIQQLQGRGMTETLEV